MRCEETQFFPAGKSRVLSHTATFCPYTENKEKTPMAVGEKIEVDEEEKKEAVQETEDSMIIEEIEIEELCVDGICGVY